METVRSNLQLLTVTDAEIAVREWGEGEAAVLAWHSLGPAASGATMGELAPALGDAGYRLFAVDAPGFGASPALPPERYALPSAVELFWGVADALGMLRPVLLGHSWGGVVAAAAVGARPGDASGLILLDSGHLDYQDAPGYPDDTSLEALLREHESPERQVRATGLDDLRAQLAPLVRRPLTDELLASLLAGLRKQEDGSLVGIPTPESRAAAMNSICDVRASSLWPALAHAGTPILVLLATEPESAREQNERAAPAFAAAVSQAEIVHVPRAGHSLVADAGPEVGRSIAGWLARLPG
jgi:pimeloyl-ACP methyl ester carboxylesterase